MGRNLPLQTRRRTAAGLTPRQQRAWRGRRFLSLGVGRRGSATIGTGNAAFRVHDKTPGASSLTLAIVAGGTAPVVTAAGNAITVTTPLTATAAEVVRAINFSTQNNKLHASLAPGSAGTGTVAAVGATALAGGSAPG